MRLESTAMRLCNGTELFDAGCVPDMSYMLYLCVGCWLVIGDTVHKLGNTKSDVWGQK